MKNLFLISGTIVIVLAVSVLVSLMILNETTRTAVAGGICFMFNSVMFLIFGIQSKDGENSPLIPLSVLIAGVMAILLSLGVQLIHIVVGFLILAVIVVGGGFLSLIVSSAREEDMKGIIKEASARSLVTLGWFALTLVNFGILYYIPRLI